jgi:hypothetical protein
MPARRTTARKSASRKASAGKSRKPPVRKSKTPASRKWSQRVTDTSDAMTLEQGVFKLPTARAIAVSVKRSAERSSRRKSTPYRSAMSMLTFYENRGGTNLSAAARKKIDGAKSELRKLFHKDA